MMEQEHLIELKNVSKEFDGTTVLSDIDLYIRKKEFLTLLGPSGCGKTTTLRIIGGFEYPTTGTVFFEGKDITAVPPYKRRVNTVFQKYALFPHLNVRDNIAFGLKIKKMGRKEIDMKVDRMLELVNLKGYGKRGVDQLSGGQQQRIAIARALTMKSSIVYVTHDQEEALTMSDTIVVMRDGHILQIGDPKSVYDEPANAFVANFIGESNILRGTMIEDELVHFCGFNFPCVDSGFGENAPVDVVIRPEDIMIVGEDIGQLTGVVQSVLFKGVHYEMMIDTGETVFKVHSTIMQPQGSRVGLTIVPYNIHIMHPMPEPPVDEEAIADV